MLKKLFKKLFPSRQIQFPAIDLQHPLVIQVARELQALQRLPISTQEERKLWYEQAMQFSQRLGSDYLEIYSSLPHEIEHYISDADIRANDPGYKAYQEELLADLLQLETSHPIT